MLRRLWIIVPVVIDVIVETKSGVVVFVDFVGMFF